MGATYNRTLKVDGKWTSVPFAFGREQLLPSCSGACGRCTCAIVRVDTCLWGMFPDDVNVWVTSGSGCSMPSEWFGSVAEAAAYWNEFWHGCERNVQPVQLALF